MKLRRLLRGLIFVRAACAGRPHASSAFVGRPGPSAVGGADADATFPLSAESFWRRARSEDFYRSTRQQNGYVQQEVIALTKWTPPSEACAGCFRKGAAPAASAMHQESPPPVPQDGHRRQEQRLQREARLVYAISTPLDSFDAAVAQEHVLSEEQDGTICYSQTDRISEVAILPGGLSVKTTFVVTPAERDDSHTNAAGVRVRVDVAVGDVALPLALRWLKGRVTKIIRNVGKKQAVRWLEKMAEAQAQERGK